MTSQARSPEKVANAAVGPSRGEQMPMLRCAIPESQHAAEIERKMRNGTESHKSRAEARPRVGTTDKLFPTGGGGESGLRLDSAAGPTRDPRKFETHVSAGEPPAGSGATTRGSRPPSRAAVASAAALGAPPSAANARPDPPRDAGASLGRGAHCVRGPCRIVGPEEGSSDDEGAVAGDEEDGSSCGEASSAMSPLSAYIVDVGGVSRGRQTRRAEAGDLMEEQRRRFMEHVVRTAPLVEGQVLRKDKSDRRDETATGAFGRHRKALALVGCLCAVLAVAIPVAVVFSTSSGDDRKAGENDSVTLPPAPDPDDAGRSPSMPRPSTTPHPTSDRYASIRPVLERASGPGAMDDRSTPQHRALVWLAEEDGMAVDPAEDEFRLVQRYALATIFFATGGESAWERRCNFLSSESECLWNETVPEYGIQNFPYMGVFCKADSSTVDYLIMPMSNLTGTLPEEIGLLSGLLYLGLYSNELYGPVPASLGKLEALRNIHLYNNSLTGSIPLTLGRLDNLETLLLHGNHLTGPIPPVLRDLRKLQDLRLNSNKLNGSMPEDLGSLKNLQKLYLFENELSGTIPSSLGKLRNLRLLYLHVNKLSGPIPNSLSRLSDLAELVLAYNKLTGTIPRSLNDLSRLEILFLSQNLLTGNPPLKFGSFPVLQTLFAWGNLLSGTIPRPLFTYGDLRFIELAKNFFVGTVSPKIRRLSLLEGLFLDGNKLNGTIPASMGKLAHLTQLDLGENKLTGTLPRQLGDILEIEEMVLYNNTLNGTIPESLSRLSSLYHLDLGNNSFTGDLDFMCDNRSYNILRADCYGADPEISCACCTSCCSDHVLSDEWFDCFAV